MSGLLARWKSLTPSGRLRVTGGLILVAGIAGAALFYWIRLRSAQPEMDEFAAGYLRAQEHQTRLMMGPMGVTLSQWVDAVARPGVQALLIVAFAAFVAYMCFHHARLQEDEPGGEPRFTNGRD